MEPIRTHHEPIITRDPRSAPAEEHYAGGQQSRLPFLVTCKGCQWQGFAHTEEQAEFIGQQHVRVHEVRSVTGAPFGQKRP